MAVTGLLLVGFVVGHLAGNFLIFAGPDAFNGYAAKLASLRPGFLIVEFGLAAIFLGHVYVTMSLVIENKRARGTERYAVDKNAGDRTLGSRTMPYTGIIIFLYVIVHIFDFTFNLFKYDKTIEGIDYGLYGLVYNAFSNPLHAGAYIFVMVVLGMHLSHAIQSLFRTFGFANPCCMNKIVTMSLCIGVGIAVLYSSIPVLILLNIIGPATT